MLHHNVGSDATEHAEIMKRPFEIALLTKNALELKSGFFENAVGCGVARQGPGFDPVQGQESVAKNDDGTERLGREASSPVVRMRLVADAADPPFPIEIIEVNGADEGRR